MRHSIFFILLLIFQFSCENDMPLDVKNNTPKLIVNAILTSSKSENEIRLALTGKHDVSYLDNASISLFINGELKEQIVEPDGISNVRGLYKTNIKFVPQDIIRIEVNGNNGEYYAYAEAKVPDYIEIDDADFTVVDKGQWNKKFFRVRTKFTDSNPSLNFYRLIIEKHITLSQNGNVETHIINERIIAKEDVVLTDGQPSLSDSDIIGAPTDNIYGVFDNSRIDGEYTMIASIPYYTWLDELQNIETNDAKLVVRLQGISEKQYLYLKALNIYDSDNFEEAISTPIRFPNNIEGGIGVFGVSSETSKTLQVEDYILFPTF